MASPLVRHPLHPVVRRLTILAKDKVRQTHLTIESRWGVEPVFFRTRIGIGKSFARLIRGYATCLAAAIPSSNHRAEQAGTAENSTKSVEVEWAGCAEEDGLLRRSWNDTEYRGHRLSELITQRSLVQIQPPQPTRSRGYG